MKNLVRCLIVASLALCSLLVCSTQSFAYVELFVNSTGDEPDLNPGDGQCATASGTCTLRAAIQEISANTNTADGAGIQLYFNTQATINLANDLPPILKSNVHVRVYNNRPPTVEINGHGHSGLDFRGNNCEAQDLTIHDCTDGVVFRDCSGGRILTCKIGTDMAGTSGPGNSGNGVLLLNSSGNEIYGSVISGNGQDGIFISGTSSNSNIHRCMIGTDITGSIKLANVGNGVHILNGSSNQIRGDLYNGTNVISGNVQNGIFIEGATAIRNFISGTRIGTDLSGTSAIGNSLNGVLISGAPNTELFGSALISGNNGHGIHIDGAGATGSNISGVMIGTDRTGTKALGNSLDGVNFSGGAGSSFINGNSSPVTIAFNGGNGITLVGSINNYILADIFNNSGLPIDRGGDGATPNDPLDADNIQNTPVITSASSTSAGTTVVAKINSKPNTNISVYLFVNETSCSGGRLFPNAFLSGQGATTDASGKATYNFVWTNQVPNGAYISAMAVGPGNNVSEFSPCVQVGAAPPAVADLTLSVNPIPDPAVVTGPLVYTVTVHNNGPQTATSVTITNTVSPDVFFVTASTGCTEVNDVVTCNIGDLASGASATITIGVTPFSEGVATNKAVVTAKEMDPDPSNNSLTTLTQVFNGGPAILSFSAAEYRAKVGDAPVEIKVIRSGGTSSLVTVDYSTTGDTAIPGFDYEVARGTLTFDPGVTERSFTITLIDRKAPRLPEMVINMALSNPTGGAQLGLQETAHLTIKDNYTPDLGFLHSSGESVYENVTGGKITLRVIRLGDPDVPAKVHFKTRNGTAKELLDYKYDEGDLDFPAGKLFDDIEVEIIDNTIYDGNRFFYVELSNPVGATIGSGKRINVLILDNEVPATPTTVASLGTKGNASIKGPGSLTVSQRPAGASLARFGGNALAAEPIFDISVSGSDPATTILNLAAIKGAAASGFVTIGSIIGEHGLKGISGSTANLVDIGILLGGYLGTMTIHDILDGAGVSVGGGSNQLTTITAHVIGDDSIISLGSAITKFSAARIGTSTIIAPSIASLSIAGDKKLLIPGDLNGAIILSGDGVLPGKSALGKLSVANTMSNAEINVTGNIGTVSAAQMFDSAISAGFIPADSANPLSGGYFAPGLLLSSAAVKGTFRNSFLGGAKVGKISLGTVLTANGGQSFGVIANESISSVGVTTPAFKYNPSGGSDQNAGDFHVILK